MQNKEAIIAFKVEEETKTAFVKYCKENYTTPSSELRKFVSESIKPKKI